MKLKTFALAAVVAATVLGTASTADAQFRARRTSGYSYSVPYSYGSTYSVPAYNGVTSVGSYTPLGGTQMIVPGGGFYSAPNTSFYTPSYGSFYNSGFNNSGFNNTFNRGFNPGVNISPAGANIFGRNWRW